MRKVKTDGYAGTRNPEESERERINRELSRKAAEDGMVLVENNGMLPLLPGTKIALYGAGAHKTVIGGIGSGDVNERYSVNIEDGLKRAGFRITTTKWLDEYTALEAQVLKDTQDGIKERARKYQEEGMSIEESMITAYIECQHIPPSGNVPDEKEVAASDTDTAIYIVSRNAGEGRDRVRGEGDYLFNRLELDAIAFLRTHYSKLMVVINCGGVMDLSFMDTAAADALMIINHPGMEGGTAFGRLISGEVTPSGKLADTWAKHYEDYPNSETFSHNSGDVMKEYYYEGIYVGYRYFEKAGIKPRYPFGYGISYTDFKVETSGVTCVGNCITVKVNVTNTGNSRKGREVVQVYVSLPEGVLEKEVKRLAAFAKTKELPPGGKQEIELTFAVSDLCSYSESKSMFLLEKGYYGIMVGTSSVDVECEAYLEALNEIPVQKVAHICPLKEALEEISLSSAPKTVDMKLPVLVIDEAAVRKPDAADVGYSKAYEIYDAKESDEIKAILDQMTPEQMAMVTCGAPSLGGKNIIGSAAVSVMGAAGETTSAFISEPWNLANIIFADGPAGLRLCKTYQLNPKGELYAMSLFESYAGIWHEDGTDYYQYCTRIPSGTLLAQSFDPELLTEVGNAIAMEMLEFHVTLWLAPGMNIHRNPLCGRNFEYYSEDPYLTGKMAAAITKGVQQMKGVGTTIKHYACNNQEDNRQHCDSILSERALREIYLKGFEIAVREAEPASVMTSYNLINGIHAANNYDLCTNVLKKEWGYQGMVMTDWVTTGKGGSSAALCMRVGNDLIMPGTQEDIQEITDALKCTDTDSLQYKELRACAARVVRMILKSDRYQTEQE